MKQARLLVFVCLMLGILAAADQAEAARAMSALRPFTSVGLSNRMMLRTFSALGPRPLIPVFRFRVFHAQPWRKLHAGPIRTTRTGQLVHAFAPMFRQITTATVAPHRSKFLHDPYGHYIKLEAAWQASIKNGTEFLRPDAEPLVKQVIEKMKAGFPADPGVSAILLSEAKTLLREGIPDRKLISFIAKWLAALGPNYGSKEHLRFTGTLTEIGRFQHLERGARRFAVFSGVDEEVSRKDLNYLIGIEGLLFIGIRSKRVMADGRLMWPMEFAMHDAFHAQRPWANFFYADSPLQMFPFLSWQVCKYLRRVLDEMEKINPAEAAEAHDALSFATHEFLHPYSSLYGFDPMTIPRFESSAAGKIFWARMRSLFRGILVELYHQETMRDLGPGAKWLQQQIAKQQIEEKPTYLPSGIIKRMLELDHPDVKASLADLPYGQEVNFDQSHQ
jgi:hypothetical protein